MDGKLLRTGTDIEDRKLDVRRMVHILTDLFVEENVQEKEWADARDKARAMVLRAFNGREVEYDSLELYGTNEYDYGSQSDVIHTPLPPVTQQNESGYVGLDPPLA